MPQTNAQRAAYQRAWRLKNPDKIKEIRAAGRARRSPEQIERDREYRREYARQHPQKPRPYSQRDHENHISAAYRMSGMEYAQRLEAQCGGCKICGAKPGRFRLSVDHCHATGRVRGLLCRKCNAGLGCFGDSPTVLQAALDYLRAQ